MPATLNQPTESIVVSPAQYLLERSTPERDTSNNAMAEALAEWAVIFFGPQIANKQISRATLDMFIGVVVLESLGAGKIINLTNSYQKNCTLILSNLPRDYQSSVLTPNEDQKTFDALEFKAKYADILFPVSAVQRRIDALGGYEGNLRRPWHHHLKDKNTGPATIEAIEKAYGNQIITSLYAKHLT